MTPLGCLCSPNNTFFKSAQSFSQDYLLKYYIEARPIKESALFTIAFHNAYYSFYNFPVNIIILFTSYENN
jgi:hypothetical protein